MPFPASVETSQWCRELVQALQRSSVPFDQAIVFGSLARGTARPESDLDVAVGVPDRPLSAAEKMVLIEQLAEVAGRPVDLVDLRTVGEPLLSEILRDGIRLHGTEAQHAALMLRHLYAEADFLPLQRRILAERRLAWIGA